MPRTTLKNEKAKLSSIGKFMASNHRTKIVARRTTSKRVHRVLNIIQSEIDELAATDHVKSITSSWGLSIRPQSLKFLLSKKHRSRRSEQRKQTSTRLNRQLNPPLDHSQVLMPRFTGLLTRLIPGDPTGINPSLGLPPPQLLIETLERINHMSRTSMFSSIATATNESEKSETSDSMESVRNNQRKNAAAHKKNNRRTLTLKEHQHEDQLREEAKRRRRDPKHFKLVQDARDQQHKLRQGIVLLQSRVEECQNLVGRTTNDNNLALRLGHEKIQHRLNKRKNELEKSTPPPSTTTRQLWLLPLQALEKLLKNGSVTAKSSGYNSRSSSHSRKNDSASSGGGGSGGGGGATHRRRKEHHALFRKRAASARGLTTGLNAPDFGHGLYFLKNDSKSSRPRPTSAPPMKKKFKPFKSLGREPQQHEENIHSHLSLPMASHFHLTENLLRRFEFELLQEDRAVSQILCKLFFCFCFCFWSTLLSFAQLD